MCVCIYIYIYICNQCWCLGPAAPGILDLECRGGAGFANVLNMNFARTLHELKKQC